MKIRNARYSLLILISMVCQHVSAQKSCPVIPLPGAYEQAKDVFTVGKHTSIIVKDTSLHSLAVFLQMSLKKYKDVDVKIGAGSDEHVIVLEKNNAATNTESYALRMTKKTVTISAPTREGVFNGIATLLQIALQSPVKKSGLAINCWNIQDTARYAWRGLMLDESRHFFGKETVKTILDWMAFYKLNRFHWHLTDAPGWRLEIKQFPLLTSIGGIGNHSDPQAPVQYYTTADIREIVQYAQERCITVIPEIDMPGHATAANKAYPEFSGGGTGKYPNFTFNPGKEATYPYLTAILGETAKLFPSQMIHLGGDEVSFGIAGWKDIPEVQELMRKESLSDLKAVERYFMQRMTDSALKMYDKVLLWDEAADASLPVSSTIIFWWRQEKPEQLSKALQKGHNVVLCPRFPFYFDFLQDSTHQQGRKWGKRINSLDKVYDFPDNNFLAKVEKDSLVLGVQANLWTEQIKTPQALQFMLFPRIAALSEAAWTGRENRNYQQFLSRLRSHLVLYGEDGIYYYNPFTPGKTPEVSE